MRQCASWGRPTPGRPPRRRLSTLPRLAPPPPPPAPRSRRRRRRRSQVERVAKVGGLYKNFTSGQALTYLDGTLPGGAWQHSAAAAHSDGRTCSDWGPRLQARSRRAAVWRRRRATQQ